MFNDIRNEFDIYKNQPELIYFDSAATSLTPNCVIDEIVKYYKEYRSPVNRGIYKNAYLSDVKFNETRLKVSEFINSDIEEIVFTKSTTNSLNYISNNIAKTLMSDDIVLVSELEHHSNLVPWMQLSKEYNFKLKYIPIENNTITLKALKSMVNNNVKVISLHHVSNVMGNRIELEKICKFCNKNNIIVIIDGAQGVLSESINVKELGCDFYVFSAHKVFGPTGVGILYGKKDLLDNMFFDYGGDMVVNVSKEEILYKSIPSKLEAGTPNISDIIAFGKSIDFINKFGIDNIHNYILDLRNYAIKKLSFIDEVTIYNKDIDTSIIIFNINGISIHDALSCYDKFNICMRGGHMCNQLTTKFLEVDGVLRVSLNIYNNKKEIDRFIEVTNMIINDPFLWWE